MHYKPHVFHILILRDYPVVSMSHDPENVLRPRCCSTPLLLCSDPLLLLRPRCCFLLRPRCCFTPTPLLRPRCCDPVVAHTHSQGLPRGINEPRSRERTPTPLFYSDPVVATPLFYSDPVVVLLRPRCCDPVVCLALAGVNSWLCNINLTMT
jgi:hypothetical protein